MYHISYRILLSLLVVAPYGFSQSAQAQPEHYGASVVSKTRPPNTVKGGDVIVIRGNDCRLLEKYVQAPDVAYKPGVTRDGRQVAPADVSPTPAFGQTDDLNFAFTVRLNQAVPAGGMANGTGEIMGEAPIGKVEFHNGVVSFNGVPLEQDQLRAVSSGCASARKDRDMAKKRK